MKSIGTIILAALIFTGFSGGEPARAQSIFLEPNTGQGIHLEAVRPSLGAVNFTNLSYSYYLSGRVLASEGFGLRFEVPFAAYNVQDSSGDSGSGRSSFGNPYAGVEVGPADRGVQGEFGLRLPIMSDEAEAADFGLLADPVERMEAHFGTEYLPLFAGLRYRHRSDDGFALMLRAVPVIWFYIGDYNGDTEVSILHSVQTWYEADKVGVGVGISGRFIATGDADGFGERSIYQFGFFANYAFGNFLPGFQVRLPLDHDLKDDLHLGATYSLSVGLSL